jgi:hypothetical protein
MNYYVVFNAFLIGKTQPRGPKAVQETRAGIFPDPSMLSTAGRGVQPAKRRPLTRKTHVTR